jgi:hypothetical protein
MNDDKGRDLVEDGCDGLLFYDIELINAFV